MTVSSERCRELVVPVGAPLPVTLVISDEAVALLSATTPEGAEARRLVREVVRYGRKAGIGWSVSRRALTFGQIPSPLARIMRELATNWDNASYFCDCPAAS